MALAFVPPPIIRKESVWRGKTLLVDCDGTLVVSKRLSGPTQNSFTVSDFGGHNNYFFEITQVNWEALRKIRELKDEGVHAILSSGAGIAYLQKVIDVIGARDIFDRILDMEFVRYTNNGQIRCDPKRYDSAINDGALSDYVAIGNDPRIDIAPSPVGLVTVIAPMETPFSRIESYLRMVLGFGMGHFARGFDRLLNMPLEAQERVRFALEERYFMIHNNVGEVMFQGYLPSRVIYFNEDDNEAVRSERNAWEYASRGIYQK